MKKTLTLLAASLGLAASVGAQLPNGSVAPNFTLKDLAGNTHTLYDYLDAGKTVFIDFSAAWCSPCWGYHNGHALRDLYTAHGPTGMSGVSASTTNDVMVFFIEGESTNTKAQLAGPAGGTTYADATQGDWITGTTYPILDTPGATMTAINTAWNINYFPTIYMVCRDRLVYEVGTLSSTALYAAASAGCPTYAPSSTVDAKPVPYSGADAFACNAAPQVKFQNYSTNTLTTATVNIKNGTTTVASAPWTGSLAPYGVATVSIPSFAGSTFSGYSIEVVASGDTYVANNRGEDSIFKIYAAPNAQALPVNEDFEAKEFFPYRYSSSANGGFFPFKTDGTNSVIGKSGSLTRAMCVAFPNINTGAAGATSEVIIGNFNTASATAVSLKFDIAHGRYKPSGGTTLSNDKLEVQVSTNCGSTWTTVWNKSGAALKTPNTTDGTFFIPSAGNQWRGEAVNLSAYKNANTLVKFKMTTDVTSGYAWVDNIKVDNSTVGIEDIVASPVLGIAPNPAIERAVVSFTLTQASGVHIDVVDAAGRTVYSTEQQNLLGGAQAITIPTASFAAGVYNVILRTDAGTLSNRLSVVK